jgi:hypothetical protein
MGLGSQNQNNNKLYILKPRTQDAEKKPITPILEVLEKVEDSWKITGDTKSVSGNLTKIELGERTWEGVTSPTVKITLEDTERKESYLLDLRFNLMTRSLFNSLLSLKDFNDVSISIYSTKPKTPTDKSYPAMAARSHDNRLDWRFKPEELPPIVKVKVGKQEVPVFDDLNDFLIKELRVLAEKVKESRKQAVHQESVEKVATKPVEKVETVATPEVDDVTF